MSDSNSRFNTPDNSTGLVAGVLYSADGTKLGTVLAERESNEFTFFDKYTQEITPHFTDDPSTSDYIDWAYSNGSSTPAPVSSIQCYVRDALKRAPTGLPRNNAGKGTCSRTDYLTAQFPSEGDTGSADSSFHSLVVRDVDGVPAVVGRKSSTTPTSISINESSAQGSLVVFEGYFYNPVKYPDTASGKYVTKAKLVDVSTTTTYPDYEELLLAVEDGMYVLDRGKLTSVLEGPVSGTRSLYTFDPAQKGQYVRFAYAHGDKGGRSITDVRMELTYEDGTVSTIAITDFLNNVGSLDGQTEFEQELLHLDTDTGVWSKGGVDYDAGEITPGLRGMRLIPCTSQPLVATVWTAGNAVSFSDAFGGNGDVSGYQYSIDRGRTYQSSPTFSLVGKAATEIVPMIKDSDGLTSSVLSMGQWHPDIAGSWSVDLITPNDGDTSYDDTADRGWEVDYSTELGSDLQQSTSAVNWVMDEQGHATQQSVYAYFGLGAPSSNASIEGDLTPVLPAAEAGQLYTIASDMYQNRTGCLNEDVEFVTEVVDTVTGNVLGTHSEQFTGTQVESRSNALFSFTGAGNPVKLRIASVMPSITEDWWGAGKDKVTFSADGKTVTRTASAPGWDSNVRSKRGRRPDDGGVNFTFKFLDGSHVSSMVGLDHDAPCTYSSYGSDFMLYRNSAKKLYIYESASNVKNTGKTVDPTAEYTVAISPTGEVTYAENGVVFYTSTHTADVNEDYFASVAIYAVNDQIGLVSNNFNKDVVKPDLTSSYIRLSRLRLFKGLYSDGSHHAKIVGNNLFFRNVTGDAVFMSEPHKYDKGVTISPEANFARYGTWTDNQAIKWSVRIGNGSWTTLLDHSGTFDQSNNIYLSPVTYGKLIDVPANTDIQYKIEVFGDGVGNTGVYLKGLSDNIVI